MIIISFLLFSSALLMTTGYDHKNGKEFDSLSVCGSFSTLTTRTLSYIQGIIITIDHYGFQWCYRTQRSRYGAGESRVETEVRELQIL
mmetsp:Transcript_16176/g.23481  ORF Transcript_16176/g.23481 Transcript_16176/m.23481 type:complete len:88 (-) Transcript_16176:583-846(-)